MRRRRNLPLAPIVAMSLPAFGPVSTPRLVIREVRHSDLDDLFEVNGDHEVTRFLPYASWQSPEDGVAWFTRMTGLAERGNARQLVVVRKDDDKVIGTLLLFNFDPGSARLELGYVLGRAHWGRGLMREVLEATCALGFGPLGIRRLEAEVNSSNVASIRLLRSLGFVHEGTLRKRWVAKGAAYDTDMYGLLSGEWPYPAADGQRTTSAAR
jgi:ribosomal-protein-alanine N-acetyltransferase